MPDKGTMLCGIVVTYVSGPEGSPVTIGLLTGLNGFGANRKSVDNIYNGVPDGWSQRLYSCIAMLKTFQIRVVTDTNSIVWITAIKALPGTVSFTLPIEDGYTTGAVISFKGAIVDIDVLGAPDIESRVEGSITIAPSGKPTHTAGTLDT